MKKRGSINLGISTVVVLVIAMVLIAAGISFIRTFFATGEEKLLGAFEIGDFGVKPDRNDPLVIEKGKIRVKSGDESLVRVGFYNSENSPAIGVNISIANCVESFKGTGNKEPEITSIKQDVNPGRGVGFETIFQVPTGVSEGNYICTLAALDKDAKSLAEKQVIVEVTG